jgi:hypothetical protein
LGIVISLAIINLVDANKLGRTYSYHEDTKEAQKPESTNKKPLVVK